MAIKEVLITDGKRAMKVVESAFYKVWADRGFWLHGKQPTPVGPDTSKDHEVVKLVDGVEEVLAVAGKAVGDETATLEAEVKTEVDGELAKVEVPTETVQTGKPPAVTTAPKPVATPVVPKQGETSPAESASSTPAS